MCSQVRNGRPAQVLLISLSSRQRRGNILVPDTYTFTQKETKCT